MSDGSLQEIKIRPSSLSRIIACSASISLDFLRSNDQAVFLPEALAGTVIHKLAERMLNDEHVWEVGTKLVQHRDGDIGVLGGEVSKRMLAGPWGPEFGGLVDVTKEMHEAARRYVEFVNHQIIGAEMVHVEKKIEKHMGEAVGGYDFVLGGTPDISYFKDGNIHIIDLKTGKYKVDAQGNKQLKAYAYLAYHDYLANGNDKEAVKGFRLTIYQQDRDVLFNPVISTTSTDYKTIHSDVYSFMHLFINAMSMPMSRLEKKRDGKMSMEDFEATLEYTPGGHCGFCPHLTTCDAQKARMTEFANSDFVLENANAVNNADLGARLDMLKDVERNAKYMRSIITKQALENPAEYMPNGYEMRERWPETWIADEESRARSFLYLNGLSDILKLPAPSAVFKAAKQLAKDDGDDKRSTKIMKTMKDVLCEHNQAKRVLYLAKTKGDGGA